MKLKKILPLAFVSAIVAASAHAQSTTSPFSAALTNGNNTTAFSNTAQAVNTILQFISYILWAASAVLIGMSGFKLKSGDIPGFAKTLVGGAAVFCSPFLIDFLYGLATNTNGGQG